MAGNNNRPGRKSGGVVGPSKAAQRFQVASQAAKSRNERAVGRAQQVMERSKQMTATNGGELKFVASGRRGSKAVRAGENPVTRKRANRAFTSGLTAEGFLKADPAAVFQASKGRATRMSSQRSSRGYRAPRTRIY